MQDIEIRKVRIGIDEIWHDGGPRRDTPVKKGFIAFVIKNPFAGAYHEDIMWMMDALKPLGLEMSQRLIAEMADGDASKIEAYGKGAIVGSAGELEHGGLWHVPGGYAMREALGEALAIVPSSKKVGTLGTAIDIPIHHKNAAYVRSHFDAMEVSIPDAPKPDEIVYILVMSMGGRPHARIGGLTQDGISKFDGQR
ncbi:MAG: amino acid synthesis family protein [Rhodobiaceae bacterium]|nr:amino acid synthesis family protein [Rhodobiaceae bacterium]